MTDLRLSYRNDVVNVETWVSASGKNGMRRDWLIRNAKTGETLTRATRWGIFWLSFISSVLCSFFLIFSL